MIKEQTALRHLYPLVWTIGLIRAVIYAWRTPITIVVDVTLVLVVYDFFFNYVIQIIMWIRQIFPSCCMLLLLKSGDFKRALTPFLCRIRNIIPYEFCWTRNRKTIAYKDTQKRKQQKHENRSEVYCFQIPLKLCIISSKVGGFTKMKEREPCM